jgi:EmrB/QacA subfamily drug resistance transporter
VADVGKRTRYPVTFTVLAVSVGSFALLQSLVVPVLPTIQAELHTTQNAVTWVLTAYLLSASIFTPIMGRLGDMHGKERLFVVTLVFIAVGSVLAALATSIGVMIVARVVQGVGGGALPLAFGIIRDEFPREKVAGAVGTLAALLAAGAGLGVVLAGPIVSLLDWHWLFWIPGAVVAVSAVAAHLLVPESPVRSPGRLSWVGALLMSTWLVGLLVAISEAPTWGWTSARVVALLVASVAVALIWVVVESRSKSPLIDMRMMRLPAVWTTNLVAFLIGVGMYATFAFLPQFVQTPTSAGYGFGATVTQSGLILLPSTVAMFVLGVVSGRLSARFGAKAVLVSGVAVSVLTFAMLTFAHSTVLEVLVAMVLQGIGFGLAFAAMANLIVVSVPPEQTGVASGMNANIRTIGGSIGAAVMSSVVTSQLHPDGIPLESGYSHGFAMVTVVTVIAALAALLVPSVPRRPAPTDPEHAPHAELAILPGGTLAGDESE